MSLVRSYRRIASTAMSMNASSMRPYSVTRVVAIATSNSSAVEKKKDNRPRVLVVGAGWAGYRAAYDLDKQQFDVKIISPRNHFLFTPLLPSTTVGTLEFRAIQEPVRTIPGLDYYQAEVSAIDLEKSCVHCSDIFQHKHDFDLYYDALILAPGAETNTFGIKGVENNDNVFFLKQLSHSRAIRNRLIDCFERASSPGVTDEALKRSLLTFVVVGGGPTSVEFAAELYDFLTSDVSKWYGDLLPYTSVKIIEMTDHILGAFSSSLVSYVEGLFKKRDIHLITGTSVKEVDGNVARLSNGEEISFGLMVWSTGIKQVSFVQSLSKDKIAKFPNGRLKVDDYLRVLQPSSAPDEPSVPVNQGKVFALGDCAGNAHKPLPPLAQVASQQGKYIADVLNKHGITRVTTVGTSKNPKDDVVKAFSYAHLGSMASVGHWKGVYDSPHIDALPEDVPPVKGILAFLLWRAAYWTRQVSWVNKILIPMYWFKAMIFGRDISRF
eukprot:gene3197-3408_t